MAEPPYSIFNDKICRFRFDFEHGAVSHEAVAAFLVRYDNGERPPIVGAYSDARTNSLIVVAKPEAEQSIREALVEGMIQSYYGETSLLMTRRQLASRHEELITEMAQLEIASIDAEDKASASAQLQDRLKVCDAELLVIEKKIAVVDKYMQRLSEVDSP